jgi:hypothetical protein
LVGKSLSKVRIAIAQEIVYVSEVWMIEDIERFDSKHKFYAFVNRKGSFDATCKIPERWAFEEVPG